MPFRWLIYSELVPTIHLLLDIYTWKVVCHAYIHSSYAPTARSILRKSGAVPLEECRYKGR